MKRYNCIKYIISSVLFPVMLFSCAQVEDDIYGPEDDPDCYGVFFPQQDGTGDIQIDPSDPTTFTFTARRMNTRDEITVPVVIEASHEGVFSISEIHFDADSPTAQFNVYFPTVKNGEKYDCTIRIDGDRYVSKYSKNATFISFSVSKVKWNRLVGGSGEIVGKWRDGVFAEWFNLANPNLERDIEIYERDDMPGYYRLYNVYSSSYLTDMFGVNASSICFDKTYTYIDATDPDKVWIPTFRLGVVFSAEYGETSIGSYVAENSNDFDASISSVYGRLEDGVITFPANSLELKFAYLGWFPSNSNGLHRVILPGYRALERDIVVSPGISVNGIIPVEVNIGRDIYAARIIAYEGKRPESEVAEIAEKLSSGELKPEHEILKSGTLNLSFGSSGQYTLIVAGFDESGNLVATSSSSFGYLKAGDTKDIVLNYGLICSDKYAPEGYTSKNSLEIYINGKDIQRINVGLYEREKWENNKESLRKALKDSELNDASLELVNTTGLSLTQGGLVPGTDYVLVLLAYNGYAEEEFVADGRTGGEWDFRLAYYSRDDVDSDAIASSRDDFYGEYNYYAVPLGGHSRVCLGKVTIGPSDTRYDTAPCVKVTGLFTNATSVLGLEDDSMDFYYYNGGILNYRPRFESFLYEGAYIYTDVLLIGSDGSVYNGYGGQRGTFVKKNGKSCLAMVDSGLGASMGVAFEGLALAGFEDNSKTSLQGFIDVNTDIIFVRPEDDPDPIYPEDHVEAGRMQKYQAGPAYRNLSGNFFDLSTAYFPQSPQLRRAEFSID